jgi:hypothetical protein
LLPDGLVTLEDMAMREIIDGGTDERRETMVLFISWAFVTTRYIDLFFNSHHLVTFLFTVIGLSFKTKEKKELNAS